MSGAYPPPELGLTVFPAIGDSWDSARLVGLDAVVAVAGSDAVVLVDLIVALAVKDVAVLLIL